MKKETTKSQMRSFKLTESQIEQLRILSFTSRRTQSSLIREGVDWIISNPPKGKNDQSK